MEHYVCSLCDISFEDLSILYLHMGVHVDFVDPKSDYYSRTSESSILSGSTDTDEIRDYWCNICCKFLKNVNFFTYHMQAHHEGKPFQCQICARTFPSKSSLYNHICKHVNKKSCRCTSGQHASQTKDDQPKIFESADDLHLCSICNVGFDTNKRLGNHMRKHIVYSRCHAHNQCEICFEIFPDKEKRDDHMKTHSNSHALDMVIKTVMSNKWYSETVTDAGNNGIECIGADSRKYECKLCFSVWTNKLVFWQHLLGHSEKVPYTCKICAEIFNEKSWIIHKVLECKCAACGRLVKRKDGSIHPKVCRVGNPFTCTLCVERFPTPEVFRDHMKSHYREKTSACKVCGEVLCNHETDLQEEMHRKENEDPSPALFPMEDEDDFLSDTPSAETLSQVSDEDRNVEMSSVKIESGFDFIKFEPLTVIKEEPVYEERQFLNDSAATADVEQSDFIVMTEEKDSSIPEERAIDPLA